MEQWEGDHHQQQEEEEEQQQGIAAAPPSSAGEAGHPPAATKAGSPWVAQLTSRPAMEVVLMMQPPPPPRAFMARAACLVPSTTPRRLTCAGSAVRLLHRCDGDRGSDPNAPAAATRAPPQLPLPAVRRSSCRHLTWTCLSNSAASRLSISASEEYRPVRP